MSGNIKNSSDMEKGLLGDILSAHKSMRMDLYELVGLYGELYYSIFMPYTKNLKVNSERDNEIPPSNCLKDDLINEIKSNQELIVSLYDIHRKLKSEL